MEKMHAGFQEWIMQVLQTEAKVVKKLAEEGIQKKDLSREEF